MSISSISHNLLVILPISSNSRNLLHIIFQLLYTVKEKGGKPDRKPNPLLYGLRNPYGNLRPENSQDYAQEPKLRLLDCTVVVYI
jgi:hypothetical protein